MTSLRGGRVDDDGPALLSGIHRALDRAIDHGHEDRRPEPIPEVPVDLARHPRAPELIGTRRAQRHDHPRRRARFGPQHEEPGCPWRTWPRVSPTSFVPRSKSTTEPSALKVSVAVMQVVMPGSVESIAVSSVQSMKAPLGSRNLVSGAPTVRRRE